jgi:nicotinamidase/pyrazinamidase
MSGAPAPPRRSRIPRVQNFDSEGNAEYVSNPHKNEYVGEPNQSTTSMQISSHSGDQVIAALKSEQTRARNENEADLPVFKSGIDLLVQDPDMVVAQGTTVKGDMKFGKLLRIDGQVQGNLKAPPTAGLIIGEQGTLVGNVLGLGVMMVEGKVFGNINVESLCLCESAVVHGDVAARSADIKNNATIVGQLHISAFDPLAVVNPETGKIDITGKHGKYLLSQTDAESVRQEAKEKRHKARKAARKAAKERGETLPESEDDSDDDEEGDDDDEPRTRRKRTTLLLLDPQNDFHASGSCAISGADEDADRIAEFIYSNIDTIDEIIITLDSHHRMHIAHAIFWEDPNGNEPPLYTVITIQDIEAGKWTPKDTSLISHCKYYLTQLQKVGRHGIHALTIKPEHCLIGTKGHAVVRSINDAVQDWAVTRMRKITYVFKGTNCLTDTNSFLCADVEIAEDPTTGYDPDLLMRLNTSGHLIIAGQSLSHSINCTMRDLLAHWQGPKSTISLLQDCCSVDANLEAAGATGPRPQPYFRPNKFWNEMTAAGVRVVRAQEVMLGKNHSSPGKLR